MDLWQYFQIIRRSWWLVLGLPLLVALVTALLWVVGPIRYGTEVTMLVTQRPIATNQPTVTLPDYNNFNSWAASEYIVDDLLQLVSTRRFAQDIVGYVKQQHNQDLDVEEVQEGLEAERKHRTVYLAVEAAQSDQVMWIADGAVAMLQQNGLAYWDRSDSAELGVSVLEQPERAERVNNLTALALDLVIRTLLALLLALGIAFLRHYLDQTLRQRHDVEALGLDLVGAIPVAKGANG